ncbi:MAG: ATP-dependent helicase [Acidimicrobiales bacterium]
MFETLNPQQRAAVDHDGSPCSSWPGPARARPRPWRRGSAGSSTTARIRNGFCCSPSPVGRRRRCAPESPPWPATGPGGVWGGTFHSTANRLLRNFGQSAGLSAGFTVLDHADAVELMGLTRTEEGFGERGVRFPRRETITAIYSRMVSAQAKLADVVESDFPWCAEHTDDLKTIFTAYTTAKRTHQVLDYDDLLLFWRGLTASAVGDALRALFDHILIDEYQDTNPIQADIIRGMCRPDTDLCAVGDDAQAIYGFRAATVANMWHFADHFPGATRIMLEQNYRSTMPILAVANGVLAQSTAHFDKALWSDREHGPIPVLHTHYDEKAQSASVARAVLDARERRHRPPPAGRAVPCGHHADGLELELTRRDIPYVKYGGLKYLESAHIKDLLALLRILDNPADQLAWHRACRRSTVSAPRPCAD